MNADRGRTEMPGSLRGNGGGSGVAMAAGESRALSPLRWVTVACLARTAIAFGWMADLAGWDPALAAITTLVAASAVVSALPVARAPAVGALVVGTIVFPGPFFQPYTREHLTHPEDFLIFTLNVLIFVACGLALASGLGAAAGHRGAGMPAP